MTLSRICPGDAILITLVWIDYVGSIIAKMNIRGEGNLGNDWQIVGEILLLCGKILELYRNDILWKDVRSVSEQHLRHVDGGQTY